MFSLKDILAVLDRWEAWKRITDAPDKIVDLEQRVAALEKFASGKTPNACPSCGAIGLKVVRTYRVARAGGYKSLRQYEGPQFACSEQREV